MKHFKEPPAQLLVCLWIHTLHTYIHVIKIYTYILAHVVPTQPDVLQSRSRSSASSPGSRYEVSDGPDTWFALLPLGVQSFLAEPSQQASGSTSWAMDQTRSTPYGCIPSQLERAMLGKSGFHDGLISRLLSSWTGCDCLPECGYREAELEKQPSGELLELASWAMPGCLLHTCTHGGTCPLRSSSLISAEISPCCFNAASLSINRVLHQR